MEYILNETPYKTTNGFLMNSIKVKLDLPNSYDFHEYQESIQKQKKKNLDTKIGFSFPEYYDMTIIENQTLTYEFQNQDCLVENIKIHPKKESHIILFYESKDQKEHFHFLNLDMNITKNTNITIVNLLNENSYHFISIEGTVQKNATLTTNIIDIGSKVQINRVEMNTLEEGVNQLNHIYMGKNNDAIDINYHLKNEEKKSINKIEVQGVLNDHAKKHFKGTIDFISGCSESIGEENENCILLSDTCISRSLPMLMCGEENVVGAHSVSSGKIEEDKLFYLQSRGLSKKESEKMIIRSNFGKVLEEVLNPKLKESLYQKIESLI